MIFYQLFYEMKSQSCLYIYQQAFDKIQIL